MMAKQLGSSRYKEWEMKEITSKPKGLRKSRMLKVKSTSSVDEEDMAMSVSMEGEGNWREERNLGSRNSITQLKRLSTTHHVSFI